MKLAKLTALQSVNRNKITENNLSRRGVIAACNQIIPNNIMVEYGIGFDHVAQYNQLEKDCLIKFRGTLAPCDENRFVDYFTRINLLGNYSWEGEMCCWREERWTQTINELLRMI
jgi:hypothetical protein